MSTEQHQSKAADTRKKARRRKKILVVLLIFLGPYFLCCGMNIRWRTHNLILEIPLDDDWDSSMAYSPDGSQIAAFNDGATRVYDIETGKEILQVDGQDPAYSPDGNYIATIVNSALHDPIQIWDARTGEALYLIDAPIARYNTRFHFHPNSSQVVMTTKFGYIAVWDIKTGKLVQKIKDPDAREAQFSPDGNKIYAGCSDGLLRVWDASTGGQLLEIDTGSHYSISHVIYSPDGSYIATRISEASGILLWDAASGKKLGILRDLRVLIIEDMAVSPSGKYIAGLGAFGNLIIWNTKTGLPVRFYSDLISGIGAQYGSTKSVVFSPTGDTLAVTSDFELIVIKGNWEK